MIINNARIVTWGQSNEIITGKSLLITGGKVQQIADHDALSNRFPGEEVFDAGNMLLMPGNICAHTHFYGAFARGMAIPGEPAADFVQILQKLWWKLDKALDEEAVRYSALVCLLDAIRYGTTTLIDHHASPNCIDGSLDIIAGAVEEAGLRASLCYEVTDRDGWKRASAGIDENARFLQKLRVNGFGNDLLRGHFGLHASLTLSDQTLQRCVEACPGEIGFHTHVAEGLADELDSIEKYGVRVIERLARFGVLKANSILAHGIHLDDREIGLLTGSGAWLTHQPRSNMNNAVGVAPIEKMLDMGVRVGLGNDGFSNAMWEEWKSAYLVHKDHAGDPRRMNGYQVLQMAVLNNSQLVSELYNGLCVGEIKPGAAADLIFVDYKEFTPLTPGNLPWHILFGFRDGMVVSTMVNGKFLMKDGKILTMDEQEISLKAKEIALKVWKKVEGQGS